MDIEDIKKTYAEFYEDELLIEKQKNKFVKKLKELIKKEDISSKEDEEKNEEIVRLKERIIEINNVLTNLEKDKIIFLNNQQSETKELLKELETNFQKNEKQKEIDNLYLKLLENLKA